MGKRVDNVGIQVALAACVKPQEMMGSDLSRALIEPVFPEPVRRISQVCTAFDALELAERVCLGCRFKARNRREAAP